MLNKNLFQIGLRVLVPCPLLELKLYAVVNFFTLPCPRKSGVPLTMPTTFMTWCGGGCGVWVERSAYEAASLGSAEPRRRAPSDHYPRAG